MALLAGQHTPCGQKGWLAASLQEEALENAAKNITLKGLFFCICILFETRSDVHVCYVRPL